MIDVQRAYEMGQTFLDREDQRVALAAHARDEVTGSLACRGARGRDARVVSALLRDGRRMRSRACIATGGRRPAVGTAATAAAASSASAAAASSASAVANWQDRPARIVRACDETRPQVHAVRISEETGDGDLAAGRLHACLAGGDREGQPTLAQVACAPIQGPGSPICGSIRPHRRLGARARHGSEKQANHDRASRHVPLHPRLVQHESCRRVRDRSSASLPTPVRRGRPRRSPSGSAWG